jgi:hypothetical protein
MHVSISIFVSIWEDHVLYDFQPRRLKKTLDVERNQWFTNMCCAKVVILV